MAHAKGAGPSKSEITAIESAYRKVDDLTAKFTQVTKIELLDRTVTKKGLFQYKRGGKLRIEYSGKNGKHYVSDGTTLWTYIPGDEASLATFAVDDRSVVPKEALSFLSGFGKLTKEFRVTASDAFGKSPAGTALHLVPRSKRPQYEWLDALFGGDHLLTQLVVKNLSGNTSIYNFKDIRTNSKLPDSLFTLPE